MSKADSAPLPDLNALPGEATPKLGELIGVDVIRDHLALTWQARRVSYDQRGR